MYLIPMYFVSMESQGPGISKWKPI